MFCNISEKIGTVPNAPAISASDAHQNCKTNAKGFVMHCLFNEYWGSGEELDTGGSPRNPSQMLCDFSLLIVGCEGLQAISCGGESQCLNHCRPHSTGFPTALLSREFLGFSWKQEVLGLEHAVKETMAVCCSAFTRWYKPQS